MSPTVSLTRRERLRLVVRTVGVLAVTSAVNFAVGVLALLVLYSPFVVAMLFSEVVPIDAWLGVYWFLVSTLGVPAFGLGPVEGSLLVLLAIPAAAFACLPLVLGPKLLRVGLNASVVDPGDHPRVEETLTRVAQGAGIGEPALALVDSPVPRSFAAGRRGNATVVVTRGLLERLDDDELEAVLAHEVSHLRNRDALVVCYAAFAPLVHEIQNRMEQDWETVNLDYVPYFPVIVALVRYSWRGELDRMGPDTISDATPDVDPDAIDPESRSAPVGLAIAVVAFVFEMVIYFVILGMYVLVPAIVVANLVGARAAAYLSRMREYAADRGAAAITGDPAALASALERLDEDEHSPRADLRTTGSADPLAILPFHPEHEEGDDDGEPPESAAGAEDGGDDDEDDEPPGYITKSDTHPPTGERIARLRELAREQYAD